MDKKFHTIASFVLTLFVITLLFLSGPAAALTVSLDAPSSVNLGDTVTFTINVDINDPDSYVPIQYAKIILTNPNDFSSSCIVNMDGSNTCGSDPDFDFYIQDVIVNTENLNYNEGNGYGYDSATGYGYNFGYGYGYNFAGASGSISYTITLDTSDLTAGDYTAKAEVYAEGNEVSHTYSSSSVSFSVNEASSPSSSGGGGGSGGGGTAIGGEQVVISTSEQAVILNTGTNVVFSLNNEAHSVKLASISDDHITVTVSSNPFNVDLYVGKSVKVDSNGNGINDLSMTLENIFAASARVTFKVLKETAAETTPKTTEEENVATGETAGNEVTGAVVGGSLGSGLKKGLIAAGIMAVVVVICYLVFTGSGRRLAGKLKRRGQFIFFFYF